MQNDHPMTGKNLTWQKTDITRTMRELQKNQKAYTIWLTGLSGAGKSTLANALEKCLYAKGKHTMLLDGDNIRMGLNRNLGFSEEDRKENIRRIAETSKLLNDAGVIVLSAFISPHQSERRMAREIIGNDNFVEVYVNTSLEECERRDVKGLYKRARAGEISDFTGISSVYEAPQQAEIVIDTTERTLEECVAYLVDELTVLFQDREPENVGVGDTHWYI